jgi:hypothetical protein
MNFDPQKIFIGLMDFFSILLPGARLSWLLMDDGWTCVVTGPGAIPGTPRLRCSRAAGVCLRGPHEL